ncbi:MAG: hypothetical protein ACOYK7_16260 [Pirellulales bacterium]|jgi:hypothetical protein
MDTTFEAVCFTGSGRSRPGWWALPATPSPDSMPSGGGIEDGISAGLWSVF